MEAECKGKLLQKKETFSLRKKIRKESSQFNSIQFIAFIKDLLYIYILQNLASNNQFSTEIQTAATQNQKPIFHYSKKNCNKIVKVGA